MKNIGKYELGRTLGSGTFAKVKFAQNSETKENVAVKVLDKEKILKHKMVQQIKREISIMKLVRHPNVVRLHEVLASKTKIFIVLEFITGGELFDKIVDQGKLSEDESRKYFQQLIDAVEFCHSKGVYHRDLKPENLLLDSEGNLKISDFGLSALPQQVQDDGLLHTTCGTPNYVAPEVLNDKGYDGAMADLWSCGVILFVLMSGYLPFDEPDLMTLYKKIQKAEFSCPSWFSPEAKSLLSRIMDPNPKTRLRYNGIRAHPWFAKNYSPVSPFTEEEETSLSDIDAVFSNNQEYEVEEKKNEKDSTPQVMNAFELIALSQGLNLGPLFEKRQDIVKRQTRFMSRNVPQEILSTLEQAFKSLGFTVMIRNFKMKVEGVSAGRIGHISIAVEIFEVAPMIHMVDVRKYAGNTLDYHKTYKRMYEMVKHLIYKNEDDEMGRENTSTASSPKVTKATYPRMGIMPRSLEQ